MGHSVAHKTLTSLLLLFFFARRIHQKIPFRKTKAARSSRGQNLASTTSLLSPTTIPLSTIQGQDSAVKTGQLLYIFFFGRHIYYGSAEPSESGLEVTVQKVDISSEEYSPPARTFKDAKLSV